MHDFRSTTPCTGELPSSAAARHLRTAAQRRWLGALCAASQALACLTSSSGPKAVAAGADGSRDPDAVRYRLPLRSNPVDVHGAFRCYAECQSKASPQEYLACLEGCPGFETAPGFACTPAEVPPDAACFTARRVPLASEPEHGGVVIGAMGGFVLIVSLASVCASSNTQCDAVVPDRQ